jgi:acetyl-CoA synthetase
MHAAQPFLDAREFLLARRERYDEAYRDFRWPALDRFNWALDWFDAYAAGNDRPALWLVSDGAPEVRLSFAELSERSNRVANRFRALGARRGDRLLLMIPNVAPLWETLLAAMKLGLVVVPTTTQLSRADLADRMARGAIRHVVTDAEGAAKLDAIPGDYSRVAVGDAPRGWVPYGDAYAEPRTFVPDGETRAADPLLLYFTSGTTAQPKLVLHTHQSYPVGHLSTMYWIGLQKGGVHWNISSPG